MQHFIDRIPYFSSMQTFAKDVQRNLIFIRAGNIALFSILSIFPFLLLVVVAFSFFKNTHAATQLIQEFSPFIPSYLYEIITNEIARRSDDGISQLSTNIFNIFWHFGIMIFSSGAAARSLLFSFRQISHAQEKIGFGNIMLRSVLFVITSLVFLIITSILASGLVFILPHLPYFAELAQFQNLIQFFIVLGVLTVLLNIVYKLSLIGYRESHIGGWLGSILGAVSIFTVTIAFTLSAGYLNNNQVLYGEYSQLINLMLWFYFCAISVLLGAQVNAFRYENHLKK